MDSHGCSLILIQKLWRYVPRKRRLQLLLQLALIVGASFAEVLSLGAVLPFLAVLTAPEKLFSIQLIQPFVEYGGYVHPQQLIFPLTVAFAAAVLLSGVMRLLMLWSQVRLSFAIGSDLGIEVYRRTLFQPYLVHVSRNSSEVINGISRKVGGVISTTIQPVLTLIGSTFILTAIFAALLSIDWKMAVSSFTGFGLIYVVLGFLVKHRLHSNGQVIATESTKVIKALQEGLGGIRDVLIDGCQAVFCNIFKEADVRLRHAQAHNLFIGQSPRFVVEALGMLLICGIGYLSATGSTGGGMTIPLLGTLALGAQRVLPNLQQIYSAWSSFRGGYPSLIDVLRLLQQPLPESIAFAAIEPMPFKHDVEIRELNFRYSTCSPWVLAGVNLKIKKGSRVGFVGTTGSGKSTLIDVIMGLLPSENGGVLVDGVVLDGGNTRDWQHHIAHVPQMIFLSDATIEENIAFGCLQQNIDMVRVREVANQAQISGMIEDLPEGYKTIIGERGVRLSGGQRQRIGIARALYKQASVLVLDEATSALDNQTERAVMESVQALSNELTILIVAHRLTTLKYCDMVVELSAGVVSRIGTYEEIIAH